MKLLDSCRPFNLYHLTSTLNHSGEQRTRRHGSRLKPGDGFTDLTTDARPPAQTPTQGSDDDTSEDTDDDESDTDSNRSLHENHYTKVLAIASGYD
ncbi:hypothetical protein FPOAC2_12875 [Fusarium poae]